MPLARYAISVGIVETVLECFAAGPDLDAALKFLSSIGLTPLVSSSRCVAIRLKHTSKHAKVNHVLYFSRDTLALYALYEIPGDAGR